MAEKQGGGRTGRGRPYVGITDVAARAGVSVTTVSHVLSARRPVAATTRERVLQVIEELGYRPNELARSMRKQRTNMMGLIAPDITNPFFPAVARGMLDVLTPAGYVGTLSDTDDDRVTGQVIAAQITRRVDALAVAAPHHDTSVLRPIVDAGIPVVHLGGQEASPGIDVVVTDDVGGARQITAHLIERGHRRIAFVDRENIAGPSRQRLMGYRLAHDQLGAVLDDQLIVHAATPRAPVFGAAIDGLFELDRPPDAVVCVNDMMAIAVLEAVRRRGLRVPDDLAVVGFDDIAIASLVSPPLTTVAHEIREMGRVVARLLLRRLEPEGRDDAPQKVVMPAQLVIRSSS